MSAKEEGAKFFDEGRKYSIDLGFLKKKWRGRVACAFWSKKCTGETPMPPVFEKKFFAALRLCA